MDNVSEDLDESKNKAEEDLKLEEEEKEEDYNPNRPNVLGLLQSNVPPGFTLQQYGQSEVITGPDGRKFIAQLYEQAPAEGSTSIDASQSDDTESTTSSDTNTSDTEDESTASSQNLQSQDDGDMAKTLCVNLLSELVKGSYQLFKARGNHLHGSAKKEAVNKLNCIEKKCNDLKETLNEESQSTSSNKTSEKKPNFSGPTGPNMAKENCNQENKMEGDQKESGGNCAETTPNCEDLRKRKFKETKGESSSPTNFKKAKYSWQIKGANTGQKETSQSNDTLADKPTSSTLLSNSEIEVAKSTEDNMSQSNIDSNKIACKNQLKSTEETDAVNNSKKCSAEKNGEVSQNSNPPGTDTTESKSGEGQAPFSYLERWQNHHIAKAIVDNAINKTLDEMNLGPQDGSQAQTGSSFSRQRQRIEDAGVSQVILQRGLRRQTRPTTASSTSGTTINPFINHLTQMTENMFVENLSQGLHFSARIDMAGNVHFNTRSIHESDNIMSDNISAAGSNNNSTVTRHVSAAAISLNRRHSDSSRLEQINDITHTTVDENNSFSDDKRNGNEYNDSNETACSGGLIDKVMCSESSSSFCNSSHDSTKSDFNENAHCSSDQAQNSSTMDNKLYQKEESDSDGTMLCVKDNQSNLDQDITQNSDKSALDVIEEIEKSAPSQNFLLDTAVNAVIYERGLQF